MKQLELFNNAPLPDNVEDVQYESATGTFKGQSTGKDYHGNEAVKMNEQYDRISPTDKKTLKYIERIRYENSELKEKPLWLEKQEEHLKKLKHFGIENSQTKNPDYPKLANLPIIKNNINHKKRRDTGGEYMKTGQLPVLSKQEIADVRGNKRVRDYMLRNYKPEETKPFIQYPGMKAWQKKKKNLPPTEPVKITLATHIPFTPIDRPKPDPQMIESEKKFNRMKAEIDEEKKRINNSGLAGLLGGVK